MNWKTLRRGSAGFGYRLRGVMHSPTLRQDPVIRSDGECYGVPLQEVMTVISGQTRFPEVASNFILWFKTLEVPGSPLPFMWLLCTAFQLFIQMPPPHRGVP